MHDIWQALGTLGPELMIVHLSPLVPVTIQDVTGETNKMKRWLPPHAHCNDRD
jgi:hypothetical protein